MLQVDRHGVVPAVPEHLGNVGASAGHSGVDDEAVAGQQLSYPVRAHQVAVKLWRINDQGAR